MAWTPSTEIRVVALAVCLCAVTPRLDAAEPLNRREVAGQKFLRLQRDADDRPIALETAIVHCAAPDDPSVTVDLVATVHVADKAYYEGLNREFRSYDAVLYELVTPEPSRPPRPTDPADNHPISLLQNGMKDVLNLEFQLRQVDYTARNMIHADMSPKQVAASMHERGENAMTMLARMLSYAMSEPSGTDDGASAGDVLSALFDKNRPLALKRIMAREFDRNEVSMAALEGADGSTLISGRNKVAMKVLHSEIEHGKKRIAIFFGSAHMPDFQTRLRDELRMTPIRVRWFVAWDLGG